MPRLEALRGLLSWVCLQSTFNEGIMSILLETEVQVETVGQLRFY